MKRQDIEAIVVEYRSPIRTIECVNKLLSTDIATIHIIDNSSDNSTTKNSLQAIFGDSERVNLVDANGNRGFAAAVNIGMRRCNSPLTLIINNDAIPKNDAIDKLRMALLDNPTAIIAFPSLIHAGQLLERIFYHPWLTIVSPKRIPGSYEVPRGCCMLIATDRLQEVLFDERFFMYGEELQLGWRLRNRVGALAHVPSAIVIHEGSATAVRGSSFYEERTALAHILLNRDFGEQTSFRALQQFTRHTSLIIRSLLRSLRQRSTIPLLALSKARRYAATGSNKMSAPPER